MSREDLFPLSSRELTPNEKRAASVRAAWARPGFREVHAKAQSAAWTPERREKQSARLRGHPVSRATRKKISDHHRAHGIKPSREASLLGIRNRGTGPDNPSWKGGRSILNGYICVYRPDHQNAMPNGYIYEHRLVAEQMLGRPLGHKEVVHHIDGDKANNRPTNLRVFPSQADHARHHREHP